MSEDNCYIRAEEEQPRRSKSRLAVLGACILMGSGVLVYRFQLIHSYEKTWSGLQPVMSTTNSTATMLFGGSGWHPRISRAGGLGQGQGVRSIHIPIRNSQTTNSHPVLLDRHNGLDRRSPVMNSMDHTWETKQMPTYDYHSHSYPDLMRGMSVCREQSNKIVPLLEQLKTRDFFSYFPLDLMASCSFLPTQEDPCDLGKCDVEAAEDVPEKIRVRDDDEYEFELDGWTRKDMPSDFTEYFDLRRQPERNTEYNGQRIWRFIHQKICFQEGLQDLEKGGWKRDFNRAVSGMHAAVHVNIISDMGFTEEGRAEYRRRLRDEPGSIANLYFAYMLTLCAIRDLQERLVNCNYLGDGEAVRPIMQELFDSELINSPAVLVAADNLRKHAQSPEAEEWKARLRARDLYAVMNCVQCNICRMHGKVMAMGLGAAMQVLLGTDGRGGDVEGLDRVMLGALVATTIKLGTAAAFVERFREFDGEDTSKAFGADMEQVSQPA